MSNPYAHLGVSGLLVKAGDALRLNQRQLAEKLGVSRRTIVRWTAGHTSMTPVHIVPLAHLVFPKDLALAEALAAAAGTGLEKLGLVSATPAPAPAVVPKPMPHLVDVVLCAAADALDLPPRAALRGLLAAVRRAREVDMDLEALEAGLTARGDSKRPGRGPGGKRPARRA